MYMEWLALPEHGQATPQRPSQIVHESTARDGTGQRAVITMERVSTGGTRYVRHFQRQQADAPMSAAERAKKKRVRATLFPHKVAAARSKDRSRKRDAKLCAADDSDPDENPQQMTPTTAETVLQQYRRKAVQSCVDWMLCAVERAHAAGTVDRAQFTVVPQQCVPWGCLDVSVTGNRVRCYAHEKVNGIECKRSRESPSIPGGYSS